MMLVWDIGPMLCSVKAKDIPGESRSLVTNISVSKITCQEKM